MFAILLAAAIAAPTITEAQARAAVLAELKDPESARFSGVKPLKRTSDGKVTGYCGRINAKNSYGGYAGSSVFYATAGKVVILDPSL
jgi:hypothetical protein